MRIMCHKCKNPSEKERSEGKGSESCFKNWENIGGGNVFLSHSVLTVNVGCGKMCQNSVFVNVIIAKYFWTNWGFEISEIWYSAITIHLFI